MKNKIIHIYNIYIIIFKFNFGPMDMPHKAQQNNNIIIRSYEPTFLVCTFQAKNSQPNKVIFLITQKTLVLGVYINVFF